MSGDGNPIEVVRARLDGGKRWHKGGARDDQGNVCLGNACVSANLGDSEQWAYTALQQVVVDQYRDRVSSDDIVIGSTVPRFNDHPDTTWADVERVLDKASAAWDEQVR